MYILMYKYNVVCMYMWNVCMYICTYVCIYIYTHAVWDNMKFCVWLMYAATTDTQFSLNHDTLAAVTCMSSGKMRF